MLTFAVHLESDGSGPRAPLPGVHLIGSDDVPLRAEITYRDGLLTCRKRAAGPAGLTVLWPIEGVGRFLLETARLMERTKPYVLQLELARGRLIRLFQKVEEWGLADLDKTGAFSTQLAAARKLLLEGMLAESEREAARLGDQAVAAAVRLSEEMTAAYSSAALERRRSAQTGARHWLGVTLKVQEDGSFSPPLEGVDFTTLALPWRILEPAHQKVLLKPADDAFAALGAKKAPVRVGPVLDLSPEGAPPWLNRFEADFEGMRDAAHDHVKRVVSRYASRVHSWVIVSGLNAGTTLPLTFEQIMELTRMSAALAKRLAPASQVLIEIAAPWGEYYADNPRSIPPNLYAEMVTQSGVAFDGFCIDLRYRYGLRDFFQIATMLDRFSVFNKPVHVTGVQAPAAASPEWIETHGYWSRPWNETTQAAYVRRFVEVAMGKPFVESVCYGPVDDAASPGDPPCGLRNSKGVARPALRAWSACRGEPPPARGA